MRILILILMCLISTNSFAKDRTDPATKQKIIEAINYNFDACNRENIEDVMNSCADAMPRRDEFRRETLKVFEEKDIHYSLVDVEIIEVKPPFALVRMVQKSHVETRDSKDSDIINYRNQTGLVTKEECVEYLNTLKCEKGTWKLLSIVSEMRPVKTEEESKAEKEEDGCPNGRCRPTPFDIPNTLRNYNFKPPR